MIIDSVTGAKKTLSILLLNQPWFADELRQLGHKVITAGWSSGLVDLHFGVPGMTIEELIAQLPPEFEPDVLVYLDDSGPVGVTGLERLNIPSVFYSVDAHHHFSWHKHFAQLFDCVLVAQRDFVSSFCEVNPNSFWFPLWAPYDYEPVAEKSIEASFRGNLDPKWHPKRAEFFRKLSKLAPVNAENAGYSDIYTRSKIVVNEAVKDDLNFRVFEAMMCGALLITPDVPNGLCDLFEPGVDLVLYRNYDANDAAEKINYYLEQDELRKKIAQSGREKVLAFHNALGRARDLERILMELKPVSKPRRLSAAGRTNLIGSRIARRSSDALGDKLLGISAENLLDAIIAGEPIDSELEAAIILCKHHLEERGYEQMAFRFIRLVAESAPSEEILAMSYMESLLATGHNTEALALAQTFSTSPEELIAQIPRLMSEMRKEILNEKQANITPA